MIGGGLGAAAPSPAASARADAYACFCSRPAKTIPGSGSGFRSARASCCCRQRSLWRFYTEPQRGPRRAAGCSGRAAACSAGPPPSTACCGCAASPPSTTTGASSATPAGATTTSFPFLKRMEAYAEGDAAVRGKDGPVHISRFGRSTLAEAFHEACVAGRHARHARLQRRAVRRRRLPAEQHATAACAAAAAKPTCSPRAAAPTSCAHRRAAQPRPDREGTRRRRRVSRRRRASFRAHCARGHRERRRGAKSRSCSSCPVSATGSGWRSSALPAVAHLPGVGENCRDHLHTRISFECRRPITLNDILDNPLRKALMGLRYLVLPRRARWRPARRRCTRWPRPIRRSTGRTSRSRCII